MTELVIGVSNIMSALCYSLLRVEPFNDCVFRCIYCYARWYREKHQVIVPRPRALREFAKLARRIYRAGLRPVPIRLSTLVDPFPPHEELYRISLRILWEAERWSYPVIVNTKSTLVARDPWRSVLRRLGEEGLLVIQVSIPCIDDERAKVLEPLAPPPSQRLAAAASVVEESGAGFVVRISPFIPRYSLQPSIEDVVARLDELGVQHVIVEALRIERERVDEMKRILGVDMEFEGYSLREVGGLKPVVRVSLSDRLREYAELSRKLAERGIGFATCKEGLFELHTAPNCCGMHLFRVSIALRPTLHEVFSYVSERGWAEINEVVKHLEGLDALFSDKLAAYPRSIRKALRAHEKKLLRILRKPELLHHVSPCLRLEGSRIAVQSLGV